ncbi:hypothetical protein GOP47_0004329 [Adiantum capillus-veneris]|uniref:Thioredoxin domain-containing protein n=1 Tax=Adiantum capillus-veneris TaxID=13818 RepID=A0A9D4ZPL9_ADICA|nr:hypothetical protein GOP47_0004329 [Adiantum capillus-veneris]
MSFLLSRFIGTKWFDCCVEAKLRWTFDYDVGNKLGRNLFPYTRLHCRRLPASCAPVKIRVSDSGMAELLRNVRCHSHTVVSCSSSSPASTSLQLSVTSLAPNSHCLTAPRITKGTAKLRASIPCPHAQTQLQGPSSAPPDEGIKWWERNFGATLGDAHSSEELMDIIENAHGKLVVVEFFASWCGSCRALYPKLCKLAMEHEDIIFVKVNFDDNKAFCKSMNVKVLPYFHFYQGDLNQIDSFSCSLAKLQKLKDAIAKYKDGEYSADG